MSKSSSRKMEDNEKDIRKGRIRLMILCTFVIVQWTLILRTPLPIWEPFIMHDEEIIISLEALRESEYNNTTMTDEESRKFWTALREKEYPFLAPLRESKKLPPATTTLINVVSCGMLVVAGVIIYVHTIRAWR
jgi:hypothetical protein